MKPIKFNKQNGTLTAPADLKCEQCGELPVYKTGLDIVSCWKMGWRERFAGLIYGKVWVKIRAGMTHPPIALNCEKTVFLKEKK